MTGPELSRLEHRPERAPFDAHVSTLVLPDDSLLCSGSAPLLAAAAREVLRVWGAEAAE